MSPRFATSEVGDMSDTVQTPSVQRGSRRGGGSVASISPMPTVRTMIRTVSEPTRGTRSRVSSQQRTHSLDSRRLKQHNQRQIRASGRGTPSRPQNSAINSVPAANEYTSRAMNGIVRDLRHPQRVQTARYPSSSVASFKGAPKAIVAAIERLDKEHEALRQSILYDDGESEIALLQYKEKMTLLESYLENIDAAVKRGDLSETTRIVRSYQADNNELKRRHARIRREHTQREKIKDLIESGDGEGIKKFIKNYRRKKAINKVTPELTGLIERGDYDKALKTWNKRINSLNTESTSKSFKKRAKDAIKNGKGFGSAFKLKVRLPSFSKPESQWQRRTH